MRPFADFVAALILLMAVAPWSGAAAEVLIGVGAPLSGRQSELGASIRRGAERSVAAINASGGLLGERLVLAVEDDACESAKGAESAKALAERRPAIVIGHPCAGVATSAAQVYAGQQIVFIATGVRNSSLTQPRAGPSVFRLAGRDDRQGARDTRQEGRRDARDAKDECNEGDDATRAECRQQKRQMKQDAREGARDIKQND